MKVFRVEYKIDGEGPYSVHKKELSFVDAHTWQRDTHPTGHRDGLEHDESYYYGFKTMAQLTAWFTKKDRLEMHKEGCHIVTYRMLRKDMEYSLRQAIFIRDNARVINTQPLLNRR